MTASGLQSHASTLAECGTLHALPAPLCSFALHLPQAREAELKARLEEAEEALQRREREITEQAPAGFVPAQFPPHVFAFEPQQM
jgi:hypothetical protein